MSILLLIVGYVLAVPPLFRLWRVWRERIWWAYAAEAIGAACIALGWWMRGNTGGAMINGGWAILWGVALPLWTLLQRSRHRVA